MSKWMVLTMCAVLGMGVAQAAITAGDLTPEALQEAVAGKSREEQRAAVKQALEAIGSSSMDSTEKLEALVTAARVFIREGKTADVIAEVFNSMPIEYLPAVANLLAENNFAQEIQMNNGKPWTNKQFDDFAEALVKSVSSYIEVSGTDSPALRTSILAATFVKASTEPERTQAKVIPVLPASMQAAAATYINAQLNGNLQVIAEAAGVDSVEQTPAVDPNADQVVVVEQPAETAPAADTAAADAAAETAPAEAPAAEAEGVPPTELDYLASPDPAATDADEAAEDAAASETPEAKVPMLARYSTDVLGIAMDTAISTMYDWEADDPFGNILPSQPGFGLEPIAGLDEQIPSGAASLPTVRPLPSPGYGNQYF